MDHRIRRLVRPTGKALLLALLMLLLPISVHATDQDQHTFAQRTTPIVPTTEEAEQSDAITSLDDAYRAVVQIEAVGTFEDPAEGLQLNAAGRGSGFIIDSSGVAVTNNHVVTGGALYRVFVDGYDKPLSARVLGVSECADLAVIDIQGEGFPYLDWYADPIKVGLEVYALGFPLGDPEFTMTRGIIAKAKANGDTSWASVNNVLQHDADIEPGNSGGPLVDETGKVVGVNYRMNTAEQYFAISRDEVADLIETLRNGTDVDSLGINGEAVTVGEDLYGIWVASVQSGSPADNTGIKPGDIVLNMEGVDLATDGTMATYCEILRSHSPDDLLTVEVLRFKSNELLKGQINGRPLETSFTLDQGEESNQPADQGDGAAPDYAEYTTITDEQGLLSAEVPTEWADVREEPWTDTDENQIGFRLSAAPDLETFSDDWGMPGVVFSYSDSLVTDYAPDDMLDWIDYSNDCTYGGRSELPEGFYTGVYDVWEKCGDGNTSVLIVGMLPETEDYLLRIEIYTASEKDMAASNRILDSFAVATEQQATPDAVDATEDSIIGTVDEIDTSGLLNKYTFVRNDAISGLFPSTWKDTVAGDWEVDGEKIGLTYSGSTNQKKFNDGWETAGVTIFSAQIGSDGFDPAGAVDSNDFSDTCTYADRVSHRHTIYGITYTGVYDVWTDCGGETNTFIVLSAVSEPADHMVLLYFQAVSEADAEAFDLLQRTFFVETPGTSELIANTQQADVNRTTEIDLNDFAELTDDEGEISLLVPKSWSDTSNSDWEVDGDVIGRQVSAAPDLKGFNEAWDTPGIFAGISAPGSADADPADVLDGFDYKDDCSYDDRYEFENEAFTGAYDIWTDCGDIEGSVFMIFAAHPVSDQSRILLLYINLISEEDFAAFETIVASVALADAPAVDRAEEPQSNVTATVATAALNLRSGPGTNYGRLASVNKGDVLAVAGQKDKCAWLLVFTPSGQPGWVSGRPEYVTINTDCSTIPEAEAPAAPPAASGGGSAGRSAGQGCYTFQNKLGAELTITFTNRDTKWNKTFKVAPKTESQQCFDPGPYTYTLDAPPPWGSTNGEMVITAGDNVAFPITAE